MEKIFYYDFMPSNAEEEILKAYNVEDRQTFRTLVQINGVYPPPVIHSENPWMIRKILTSSEVGSGNFLIFFNETFRHVLRYWRMDMSNMIVTRTGSRTPVTLLDITDENGYKCYPGGDVYLMKLPTDDFMLRCFMVFKDRNLNAGDEIGMYWDPIDSVFKFKLLKRAI